MLKFVRTVKETVNAAYMSKISNSFSKKQLICIIWHRIPESNGRLIKRVRSIFRLTCY